MSKYGPLTLFLAKAKEGRISLNFKDIEALLGFRLPPSAHSHPAWWSNTLGSHVQARAWLEAGFRTAEVDVGGRRLVFVRDLQSTPGRPQSTDPRRDGRPGGSGSRHPA